jgi:phosphatidylinositol dimannoside acyltransferase
VAPGPHRHPALSRLRDLKKRAPYFGYRAASALANALPLPVASVTADGASRLMYRLMRGRRSMAERHAHRVLGPGASAEAVEAHVRKVFESYGRYWLESFRLPGTTPAELDATMSWEGLAHLDGALAEGRGAIVTMPHLGGWDLGAAWLASVGCPATVVVEAVEPPELFEWFVEFRRSLGLTIVPLGPDAGTALLRALKAGGIVGLIADRDIPRTGVEVDLFGERTTLPSGPATLALRTGAPLIVAGIYFDGRRGHRGVVRPPLEVARTGRLRDDVARVTQALAHELEGLIRVAPDQWHLLQPNWPSDFESVR